MYLLSVRAEQTRPEPLREALERRAIEILERRQCDWVEAWRCAEEELPEAAASSVDGTGDVGRLSDRSPGRAPLTGLLGVVLPPRLDVADAQAAGFVPPAPPSVGDGRGSRFASLPAPVMRSAERSEVDPQAAELVARARRGGASLDGALRGRLEAALGVSLDGVRVHTDREADAAARALSARAFAIGDDVFFRDGAYDPHCREGQRLIAHEVAHTVQARGATPVGATTVSQPEDAAERAADAFADAFVLRLHGAGVSDGALRAAPADASVEPARQAPPDASVEPARVVSPAAAPSGAIQRNLEDETTTPERRGVTDRRQVVTFITGTGRVFELARNYWRGRTDQLVTSCSSLEEILTWLRDPAHHPAHGPWAEINIVTHANERGDTGMPIRDGGLTRDGNPGMEPDQLRRAVDGGGLQALPDDIVDRQTNVNIHGCAIGNSPEMLHQLSRAFGGDDAEAPTVYGPRHLQTYGTRDGRSYDEWLTEYWYVDYREGARPPDDELIRMFQERYPDAGLDWRRMLPRAQVHTAHMRFRTPPDTGSTMSWIVPPRDRNQSAHEALVRAHYPRMTWHSVELADMQVEENLTNPSIWERRTHRFTYRIRYTPDQTVPDTVPITVREPVPPRSDADWESVLRWTYGPEYDAYRWTGFRTHFEGSTRPGEIRRCWIEADGHRTILRIERDLMDHGRRAEPSRNDPAHYGRYAPPPPPPPPTTTGTGTGTGTGTTTGTTGSTATDRPAAAPP